MPQSFYRFMASYSHWVAANPIPAFLIIALAFSAVFTLLVQLFY